MIIVKKIHYYVIVGLALVVSLTSIALLAEAALERVDQETQELTRR